MADTKYNAIRILSRALADACKSRKLALDGHDKEAAMTFENNMNVITDDLMSFINFAFYSLDDNTFFADEFSGAWEVRSNNDELLIEGYHNRIRFY